MIDVKRAKRFCKDDISKIQNYDKAIADTTQTWHCHHRLELTLDGEFAHKKEDLIRMDMYYKRPYFELIFLTKSEHRRLHSTNISDATRQKMSEAKKDKKREPFSDEHKKNMSKARKAYWAKRKSSTNE